MRTKDVAELMWKCSAGRGTAQDIEEIKKAGYSPEDFSNTHSWGSQWNEFRACDALEYARAYDWTIGKKREEITARAKSLADRMQVIFERDGTIPSYLLAAYRGYENALLDDGGHGTFGIVKLDDSAPNMVVREAWWTKGS